MRMRVAAVSLIGLMLAAPAVAWADEPAKLSVLIVDGMNNHDWPRATRILKEIYQTSGRFKVEVSTTPPTSQPADAWDSWRPDLHPVSYSCGSEGTMSRVVTPFFVV